MLTIRKANEADNPGIIKILKDLNLYYKDLVLKDFWVAEESNVLIGTAQIVGYKDFLFLGSLGVLEKERGRGIATALLKVILKNAVKDVYLYTIIPAFFYEFGFRITSPPLNIPSKERYECADCHSEKCVCMVRNYVP